MVLASAGGGVTAVLFDILIVLVAAKVAAEIAERIGVPAVAAEIVAGILVGPSVLDLVGGNEVLAVLGEIGVGGLSASSTVPDGAISRLRASGGKAEPGAKKVKEAPVAEPARSGEPIRQSVCKWCFKDIALEPFVVAAMTQALDALEAAHISPYLGSHTNHVQNGLLLRADLHSLFDLGLIAIDPDTLTIRVSQRLHSTVYAEFHGRRLRIPNEAWGKPNADALRQHLDWAGI